MTNNKQNSLLLKIYCSIVNKNEYVKDFYQIPIILDEEYHSHHRIKEWFRLIKLVFRFRVLKKRITQDELKSLMDLRSKRDLLYGKRNSGDICKKGENRLLSTILNGVNDIGNADLWKTNTDRKIVAFGDPDGEIVSGLARSFHLLSVTNNKAFLFWFRFSKNTSRDLFIPTITLPVDMSDEHIFEVDEYRDLSEEDIYQLFKIENINTILETINKKYINISDGFTKKIILAIYSYFCDVIDILNPTVFLIISKNEFCEQILAAVLKEYDIPYYFVAKGDSVGTFYVYNSDAVFDDYSMNDYETYSFLSVSESDCSEVEHINNIIGGPGDFLLKMLEESK